jgi:4'-phosphopantetheinyl transferase
MTTPPVIYPVILPVPVATRGLAPRERVRFLSQHAREALRRSAGRLGIELEPLHKNARGAPLPFQGHFWSLTHKPEYVGAVLAPSPVGMDLEPIRPCSSALLRRTATEEEWALAGGGDRETFFLRYWTAKEAVLKTGSEGIKDLSRCLIRQVIDATRLGVDYHGRRWTVEQAFFDGHVASVACQDARLEWSVPAQLIFA